MQNQLSKRITKESGPLVENQDEARRRLAAAKSQGVPPCLAGIKIGKWNLTDKIIKLHGANCVVSVCECGNTGHPSLYRLLAGLSLSCGCYRVDYLTTHGHSSALMPGPGKRSKTYMAWKGSLARCYNSNLPNYSDYGGRGISVCDRWRNSFENFLDDMGERPDGTSIDRINNDGNYEPGNCRWATRLEQSHNKRNNRFFVYNGNRITLAELARLTNMSQATIADRIKKGWSLEQATSKRVTS